jgi:hypothetical protein
VKKPLIGLALAAVLALPTGACSKDSGGGSNASATTPSSATASSPTTPAATGPVTDADVTEVDQLLHSLDTELGRLDSDMAAGEGEVQQ